MADSSLPSHMRALRFSAFGPPQKLAITEVVRPAPRSGEVLVQVQAAGLNPSDVKNVAGAFKQTQLPRTPGRDFAGVAVDGDAQWVGAEVWGLGGELGFTRDGSHAPYLRVPSAGVRRRPAALTAAQAAAAGVPFITALLMLERAQVRAGDSVLVIGGTGAVGTAAVQLARWMGARVLATTRKSEVGAIWQRSVDVAIALPGAELPQAVLDATTQRGVDAVLNAVGGETFAPGLACAARGGRVVSVASNPTSVTFDLVDFYHRELTLLGVDSLQLDAAQCGPYLDRVGAGFDRGALQVETPREVPLTDAVAAYAQVAAGGAGKWVLVP